MKRGLHRFSWCRGKSHRYDTFSLSGWWGEIIRVRPACNSQGKAQISKKHQKGPRRHGKAEDPVLHLRSTKVESELTQGTGSNPTEIASKPRV